VYTYSCKVGRASQRVPPSRRELTVNTAAILIAAVNSKPDEEDVDHVNAQAWLHRQSLLQMLGEGEG
jgi:hypothetical protein